MKEEEETITIEPNYANLMRQFGKDAVNYMERMAVGGNKVSYEDVYGLVAATRIVVSSFHTGDSEAIRAFVEFRDNFDKAASKMFERLNQLRDSERDDESE